MTTLAVVAGILPAFAATSHSTSFISSFPATFNYAKATAINDSAASIIIDLTTGANQNSCYLFGTHGFTQVGLEIKVNPVINQVVNTTACLASLGHSAIPFFVTAKAGQRLKITDGKTIRYTTVQRKMTSLIPTPTSSPIPTPTATAVDTSSSTPTSTTSGFSLYFISAAPMFGPGVRYYTDRSFSTGSGDGLPFNDIYIDVTNKTDTQARLYLDYNTNENHNDCFLMQEDHHSQVGLRVTVVLKFKNITEQLAADGVDCQTYKYGHYSSPITIDAKIGDVVTVDSGKTVATATVTDAGFPYSVGTIVNHDYGYYLPYTQNNVNNNRVDLVALEKVIYSQARVMTYALEAGDYKTFCNGITQNRSDYLAFWNPFRVSNPSCVQYVKGVKNPHDMAKFYLSWTSEETKSFLYNDSGPFPTAYITLKQTLPGDSFSNYTHYQFDLVKGNWLVEGVNWTIVR